MALVALVEAGSGFRVKLDLIFLGLSLPTPPSAASLSSDRSWAGRLLDILGSGTQSAPSGGQALSQVRSWLSSSGAQRQ